MKSAHGFSRLARESGIKIIDLGLEAYEDALLASIEPAFHRTLGSEVFFSILSSARDRLKARTAVIEPYVSTDWHDEYGRLYSRVLKDVPRSATRIHFFREVGKKAVLSYRQLFDMSGPTKKAYVGYTVLRPLPVFRVGDTVLMSPCRVNSDKDLVHCLAPFEVSLLGNHLSLVSMPFMQQETAVGVCAEADLWMLARYFNRLHEVRRYRPAEITDVATENLTIGRPPQGLINYQMVDALRQMGLNPDLFFPRNPAEAKEFIFTCIESELPVIVGVPAHVMVVIGHDYDPQKQAVPGGTVSDFVTSFIVHDDASGPYLTKQLADIKQPVLSVDDDEQIKVDEVHYLALENEVVDFCLTCFPHRVNLPWDRVQSHARRWLSEITGYLAIKFGLEPDVLWGEGSLKDVVLRTYLRRSDKFKGDLLSAEKKRHSKIISEYRCMSMPRYVWVVELARVPTLQGVPPEDRLIVGELVFDSTANAHLWYEALLAFHLDGLMYIPATDRDAAALIACPDEKPYSPLLRCRE